MIIEKIYVLWKFRNRFFVKVFNGDETIEGPITKKKLEVIKSLVGQYIKLYETYLVAMQAQEEIKIDTKEAKADSKWKKYNPNQSVRLVFK